MANRRFILLPRGRITAESLRSDSLAAVYDRIGPVGTLQASDIFPNLPNRPVNVLDSMHENGPKLTEMDLQVAAAINHDGPLRAVPEVIYDLPSPAAGILKLSAHSAAPVVSIVVSCRDSSIGNPISGLRVVAFYNFVAKWGDQGTTDTSGNVTLQLSGTKIERLFVVPDNRYWGAFRQDLAITPAINLDIESLSPTYSDSIRSLYPSPRFNPNTGVRVGVVDTGLGPHTDLNVVAGMCTVTGQQINSFQDIDKHGTHVGGLIGGNGATGLVTRGLAPNVPLCAFRVFDWFDGKLGASNYAILKAMIFASTSPFECDIINLSLGGGPYDPIVEEAVADSRNQGILVVVSAGNDGRKAVSYPAAYAGATAISAMGRADGYPVGCYFEGDIEFPPNGTVDTSDYIADFSNVGPQVACTGLGSGVLSTLPNNSFGPMSGTSMASPMIVGAAASLLSNDPGVFAMPRNRSRSNAIERLLQTTCRQRFGGGNWEGYGLPDPAAV